MQVLKLKENEKNKVTDEAKYLLPIRGESKTIESSTV